MINNKYMNIELSIIIPMYNVEEYINECIDSTIALKEISTEIIIIDDGSTDNSFQIAKTYVDKHSNIFLYHQENKRQAEARNKALSLAKGNYILFLDSDDTLNHKASLELYNVAVKTSSDIVMGRIQYQSKGKNIKSPFRFVPLSFIGNEMTGEVTFINMMKDQFYIPMACSYLHNRQFLIDNKIKFVDLIYEDEIWTLESLTKAKSVVLTNIEFYNYRRRDNSITTEINKRDRIINRLKVANYLFNYKNKCQSLKNKKDLKSWITIKILWLYSLAYKLIPTINDSKVCFPKDYTDVLLSLQNEMSIESLPMYNMYISLIHKNKKEYKLYTESAFFKNKIRKNQNIILLYNGMQNNFPSKDILERLPNKYTITTDRRYFNISKVVVFYLPSLIKNLEENLVKCDNQIWVAWNMECEDHYPWMNNDEIRSMFDIRMDYHQDADIVYPYYRNIRESSIPQNINHSKKENKICMLSTSPNSDDEFIKGLRQYIDIDSYEESYSNRSLGGESKLSLYARYKFVIAFENAICKDYVTEKFYSPLLAGSIPIYLGAPNIEELLPGENCYINVKDHKSPKELAKHLKECIDNEVEYMKYHEWRNRPFREGFMKKIKIQETDPFIRLCYFLQRPKK